MQTLIKIICLLLFVSIKQLCNSLAIKMVIQAIAKILIIANAKEI
jgi:hypothetical protein